MMSSRPGAACGWRWRCAQNLNRLRQEWRLKGISSALRVRAGINTGFCTVGNFGSEHRMDYTIIGGQVNLAARLQAVAPPDSVYVSSTTYTLVEDSGRRAPRRSDFKSRAFTRRWMCGSCWAYAQMSAPNRHTFDIQDGRIRTAALDLIPSAYPRASAPRFSRRCRGAGIHRHALIRRAEAFALLPRRRAGDDHTHVAGSSSRAAHARNHMRCWW